ncbi:hypothetical protein [Oceanisphaera psychrotolerans]|uniref:hypothetical protein n=1 Tax=Oceanisphaera psychrotolerans TaxID=1414654 RepID=UPI0015879224|nr:hypothetical protein [Oceanisphaera psychrotolerans]
MFKYYSGTERRRLQRRQILDRRDLLRWEPERQERRHQRGRRTVDNAKTLWDR